MPRMLATGSPMASPSTNASRLTTTSTRTACSARLRRYPITGLPRSSTPPRAGASPDHHVLEAHGRVGAGGNGDAVACRPGDHGLVQVDGVDPVTANRE